MIMEMWTSEILANTIEEISEEQVIERLGYEPTVWYFGGSAHNDYRLACTVMEDGSVAVSDGNHFDVVDTNALFDLDAVRSYVNEWLDNIMPTNEDTAS
jgi:hypothetical protein